MTKSAKVKAVKTPKHTILKWNAVFDRQL